jgi:peptidylamidoglycolate lyase
VEDEVHFTGDINVIRHVMLDETEVWIPRQMLNIPDIARQQAVDADDLVTLGQESICEMRSKKACGTGDNCCFFIRHDNEGPSVKFFTTCASKDCLRANFTFASGKNALPCFNHLMLRLLFILCVAITSNLDAEDALLGQGEFRYQIVPDWANQALSQASIKNGHAVAIDSRGRLFFLTDDARNNILILDSASGALLGQWTARMPGAHGLTLGTEGAREVLYITDTSLHEVRKLTLDGEELARYPWPEQSRLYEKAADYRPSRILRHPDGRFWIFDGYGRDYIHAYHADGTWQRAWGGNLGRKEDQLVHWGPHGGGLDLRDGSRPTMLIAMSDQQEIRRFSLEGHWLATYRFPGGNPRDIIFFDDHMIVPHLGDRWPEEKDSPGFISIVDRNLRIISNLGAPPAQYDQNGELQPMRSDGKTFIHPHGVAVDTQGNLFVAQFASLKAPLLKLARIQK